MGDAVMEEGEVNILLVDDDDVDALAVERALREQKAFNPLLRAHDGLEALQILRTRKLQRPFLILLDINMPRMNGIELLRHLNQNEALKRNIVYVLTTSPRDEDRMAAREHGAAEYFVKDNLAEIANRLS